MLVAILHPAVVSFSKTSYLLCGCVRPCPLCVRVCLCVLLNGIARVFRGEFSQAIAEGVGGGMIQSLFLDYTPVGSSHIELLERALGKQNCLLHTLSMRACGITDDDCQALASGAFASNPVENVTIAGDNKTKSPVTFSGVVAIAKACNKYLEHFDVGASSCGGNRLDVMTTVFCEYCRRLRYVDLRKCDLSGVLPTSVDAWEWAEHLEYLNVEENPLTGGFPECIATLPNLKQLHLGYTKITGAIPEEVATKSNLKVLDVTATALVPGSKLMELIAVGDIDVIGVTLTEEFSSGRRQRKQKPNAFLNGGRFMTTGFTRNNYDGNVSRAEYAEFSFGPNGALEGFIDYSTGAKYNKAEATHVHGHYHFGGLDNPNPGNWTQWTAGDQFFYHEAYHGGRSNFYYSGKIHGDKLIGTYKMGGRNATGTFEWKITKVLERGNLSDAAATTQPSFGGKDIAAAIPTKSTAPDYIVVSSAGSAIANGTFRIDGSFNQRPMYTCSETGIQIWNNHSQWRIGTTNNYLYCVASRAAKPPETGWVRSVEICHSSLCADGVELPAPTLQVTGTASRSDGVSATASSSNGASAPASSPSIVEPPAQIKVVGAGYALSNGVFARDGSYNSRPMYTCAATGVQIWHNHSQWRLGNTNDYHYCVNSETVSPPASGWQPAQQLCSESLCRTGVSDPSPMLEFVG